MSLELPRGRDEDADIADFDPHPVRRDISRVQNGLKVDYQVYRLRMFLTETSMMPRDILLLATLHPKIGYGGRSYDGLSR